ncbi:hypothetical protein P3T37_006232 [Kitasatospora sp. MAA4]|nr:hypothetical protein [Kitasatospora sp. MAA4]
MIKLVHATDNAVSYGASPLPAKDPFPPDVNAGIPWEKKMDTTCAIAGGVVAARTGSAGVPADWLASREPLPDWVAAVRAY